MIHVPLNMEQYYHIKLTNEIYLIFYLFSLCHKKEKNFNFNVYLQKILFVVTDIS